MTKLKGMSPYNPNPKVGFGCHSCIHKAKCTVPCEPNTAGGTGYEWNNVLNHKVFWIIKTKMKD